MQRDPEQGEGQPEQLRGERAGQWSRRIDQKNRLIYRVVGDTIQIIEIKGHYDD